MKKTKGVKTRKNDIEVQVYYLGKEYKVVILIPMEKIEKDNWVSESNKYFELDVKLRDITNLKVEDGMVKITANGNYKSRDIGKQQCDASEVRLALKSNRYRGNIILQPEIYIPANWDEEFLKTYYKKEG